MIICKGSYSTISSEHGIVPIHYYQAGELISYDVAFIAYEDYWTSSLSNALRFGFRPLWVHPPGGASWTGSPSYGLNQRPALSNM